MFGETDWLSRHGELFALRVWYATVCETAACQSTLLLRKRGMQSYGLHDRGPRTTKGLSIAGKA